MTFLSDDYEFVSVLINAYRLVERYVGAVLFARSHRHQYLVFYTARSVGCKRRAFVAFETLDSLYKPDRTD